MMRDGTPISRIPAPAGAGPAGAGGAQEAAARPIVTRRCFISGWSLCSL